ncbi:ABC transporter substrate-binding protein [Streptomyces sp. A7024]|uniref:ABC transporter substrate-binding protein n=1 Tax=Streptomyces coryli TaxID=1128680 RepID=A0A6G4TY06_9ACTN|nr:ABC transporter substrate-binding protein [Streptomyces coryli]NGN63998.1 ABC transporter substrate-binding protein [Streptomyces coryli]
MPRVFKKRRLTAGAAIIVASTMALTACGGGDEGEDGGDSKAAGYNAAIGKIANPSKKKGGTLKFVAKQDLDYADPQRMYFGMSWDFSRYYARTLVTYDTKPGEAGNKLVPDMAEDMAKVSEDGKTYTYKLRDGLTWEDGSKLTSEDIKYGISRIWDKDVITGGPGYLRSTLDPKEEYKGPYKDKNLDNLKSIETPDDQTIVFKLPKPNGDFEQMLAMPTGAPVKAAKDTRAKYDQKPFSNGPYKFESRHVNKSITLVRNKAWKKSSDPIRPALPNKITVAINKNLEENDKRLMAGDYHIDMNGTGMTQSGRTTAIQDHRDSVDNMQTDFIRYVALVTKTKPLDNVNCRKAVFYATDFAALQQTRGGKLVAGEIANSPYPKSIPGNDDYDPYGVLERKGKPDEAKAKAELKKCGKPNGFETVITARNDNPGEEDAAEAMQEQLGKVGIKLEIATFSGQDSSNMSGSLEKVKKEGYGMVMTGWGPDFPSGQGYGQPLWDSRFIQKTGNYNEAQINDKSIDKAFDDAIATTDPAEAKKIYTDLGHKILDEAYWMPFLYEKNISWRSPNATNVYSTAGYSGRYDYVMLGVK